MYDHDGIFGDLWLFVWEVKMDSEIRQALELLNKQITLLVELALLEASLEGHVRVMAFAIHQHQQHDLEVDAKTLAKFRDRAERSRDKVKQKIEENLARITELLKS